MPKELIFTSVPSGINPGSTGYCTVAKHKEIDRLLDKAVEEICFYEMMNSPTKPVVHAYRILRLNTGTFHVLSKISFSGSDHTGRTNYLAHNLIYEQKEIRNQTVSPAEMLLNGTGWLSAWPKGAPATFLPDKTCKVSLHAPSGVHGSLQTWAKFTGSGNLAHELGGRGQWKFITQGGEHQSTLSLLSEFASLGLPNLLTSWNQLTFTTYLQPSDKPEEFKIVAGDPSVPALAALSRNTLKLSSPTSPEQCFSETGSSSFGHLPALHQPSVPKSDPEQPAATEEATQATTVETPEHDPFADDEPETAPVTITPTLKLDLGPTDLPPDPKGPSLLPRAGSKSPQLTGRQASKESNKGKIIGFSILGFGLIAAACALIFLWPQKTKRDELADKGKEGTKEKGGKKTDPTGNQGNQKPENGKPVPNPDTSDDAEKKAREDKERLDKLNAILDQIEGKKKYKDIKEIEKDRGNLAKAREKIENLDESTENRVAKAEKKLETEKNRIEEANRPAAPQTYHFDFASLKKGDFLKFTIGTNLGTPYVWNDKSKSIVPQKEFPAGPILYRQEIVRKSKFGDKGVVPATYTIDLNASLVGTTMVLKHSELAKYNAPSGEKDKFDQIIIYTGKKVLSANQSSDLEGSIKAKRDELISWIREKKVELDKTYLLPQIGGVSKYGLSRPNYADSMIVKIPLWVDRYPSYLSEISTHISLHKEYITKAKKEKETYLARLETTKQRFQDKTNKSWDAQGKDITNAIRGILKAKSNEKGNKVDLLEPTEKNRLTQWLQGSFPNCSVKKEFVKLKKLTKEEETTKANNRGKKKKVYVRNPVSDRQSFITFAENLINNLKSDREKIQKPWPGLRINGVLYPSYSAKEEVIIALGSQLSNLHELVEKAKNLSSFPQKYLGKDGKGTLIEIVE